MKNFHWINVIEEAEIAEKAKWNIKKDSEVKYWISTFYDYLQRTEATEKIDRKRKEAREYLCDERSPLKI